MWVTVEASGLESQAPAAATHKTVDNTKFQAFEISSDLFDKSIPAFDYFDRRAVSGCLPKANHLAAVDIAEVCFGLYCTGIFCSSSENHCEHHEITYNRGIPRLHVTEAGIKVAKRIITPVTL